MRFSRCFRNLMDKEAPPKVIQENNNCNIIDNKITLNDDNDNLITQNLINRLI